MHNHAIQDKRLLWRGLLLDMQRGKTSETLEEIPYRRDGFTMGTVINGRKVEVPVDTLRSHVRFIAHHNLWDEVDEALKEAGIDTISMDLTPVSVISGLIADKEKKPADEPDHTKALVTPECVCNQTVTNPPKTSGGDAGAGDGGPPPQ